MMKVKELIERLQRFDPNLDVLVEAPEGGGYDYLRRVSSHECLMNVREPSFQGMHESALSSQIKEFPGVDKKLCVILCGLGYFEGWEAE